MAISHFYSNRRWLITGTNMRPQAFFILFSAERRYAVLAKNYDGVAIQEQVLTNGEWQNAS